MSEEVDRKLYAHYKGLTEGTMKTGNPVRDDLIVSDAKKHLADLIKKTNKHSPNFNFEEPKEETVSEEDQGHKDNKPKSKGKK